MNRNALADRLVTYADTVVAFALVNGFAFVISLSDPEIRCSLAEVSGVAFALNAIFPIIGTYALFWLRGYELQLRRDEDAPEPSLAGEDEGSVTKEGGNPDPIVEHIWTVLFRIKLGLVWLFALLVIIGVYGATKDLACEAGGLIG